MQSKQNKLNNWFTGAGEVVRVCVVEGSGHTHTQDQVIICIKTQSDLSFTTRFLFTVTGV